MKHFRPIKTFPTWLLDTVRVPFVPDENDRWGGNHAAKWIKENLNLQNLSSTRENKMDLAIYIHTHQGFPSNGRPSINHFHFPDAESANLFYAKFGGERLVLDIKDSPRRTEAIFDNFTMDDLVYLYGDPLPNLIQYHLVDMEDRLSGYFDRFKFMHQPWSHRSHWLPSAFVYVDRSDIKAEHALKWLYQMLYRPEDPEHTWQHGWESSIRGIYEFDDPSIAAMFKLAFGGSQIPNSWGNLRTSTCEKLRGPVSGISWKEGRGYIWERQANIPDYRNPREVG